jgi:putative ABC transport system permease protein
MLALRWVSGLVRRRTVRLAGLALCVALAVMLFAALGMFFTAAKARMTSLAVAGVPVDWQVALTPGSDTTAGIATVKAEPGVIAAVPVGYADSVSLESTTGGTVQTTGAGKVLGLPAGYAARFPGEVRYLSGAHDGVLLAQQTAANLHVGVGDAFTLNRAGLPPLHLRVDGVLDLPAADSLFQVVGAPAGSGATAPPDNVLVLPLARWHELFDPLAAARPGAVVTQVHVGLSHALPPDPSLAFENTLTRAHHLEAKLAGAGVVGNNIGALLDAGRADAVYSQTLFLFLGLPGVVLAWLLAAVAGASGRERRRREQALLRVRGASPRVIVRLALIEAAAVGVSGVVLGLLSATAAGRLAFGTAAFGVDAASAAVWAAASVAVGLLLAATTVALPAWRDARLLTVQSARGVVDAVRPPLWMRAYLDVFLLAAAGIVYWSSMRNAYKVVLVPEGVPTISVDYLTLLAPLMFWIGFALFAWRVSGLFLAHGRRVLVALLRPLSGTLSGVVASSMSRQRALLTRGAVIVALAASFAVSVSVFNTTYMNQAKVDAELTNGADVSVTSGSGGLAASLPASVRALPGVTAAEPMRHRLAYVGNDLQDLYGIDPSAIGRATPMSDAYFQGGTANETLARLAATPDGILVSDETVKDFQLQLGDTVTIRMQSPSDHAYHPVKFRYVGVAREFPTAPHDSFLVANATYVAKATGNDAFETLLVRTASSPTAVAAEVRKLVGPASAASVHDLDTELKVTLSALTAIDLSGLTRLELVFAAIMAAAASGLVLALGFAERKRTFAIAHALGASPRQLGVFVWSESLYVGLAGALIGAGAGWLLSWMIVKILTGVFDPPPEQLFAPWAYLAGVLAVGAVAVTAASLAQVRAARKPVMSVIRDL